MGCVACIKLNPVLRKVDCFQSEILAMTDYSELVCLISKNYKNTTIKIENFQEIYNEIVNTRSVHSHRIPKIFEHFIVGNELVTKEILIFVFAIADHCDVADDFYNLLLMEGKTKKSSFDQIDEQRDSSNQSNRLIARSDLQTALKSLIYYNTDMLVDLCKEDFIQYRKDFERFKMAYSEKSRRALLDYLMNQIDHFNIKNMTSSNSARKYFDIFDIKLLFENFPWLSRSDDIRVEVEFIINNKI